MIGTKKNTSEIKLQGIISQKLVALSKSLFVSKKISGCQFFKQFPLILAYFSNFSFLIYTVLEKIDEVAQSL